MYTGAEGQPLHWRIRFKHPATGEKWIRPMEKSEQGFTLGEPAYSAGKPLYNLANLAARPEEDMVVVEGEWAADALAKFGVLATTSGAADSAATAALVALMIRRWSTGSLPSRSQTLTCSSSIRAASSEMLG